MLNIAKFTKQEIDSQLTLVANETYRQMERMHRVYAYYLGLTDADLQAYGYNGDDIYAIRAFCNALENVYRGYTKTTLLDASVPATYIATLVQPLVI